jgi:competence protein ComGC
MKLLKDKKGFGTIEIVIILAILVGIALLFKTQITALVTKILDDIMNQDFQVTCFYVFY